MQEKFALRRTLKKVAAVGTSLAMVGITVSGALAAGLGDYPSPFNKNAAQSMVVWGADADSAAVQDVLAGLPGGASSIAYDASGTIAGALSLDDFEQGERQDIAVGTFIDDELGLQLDETDSVGLTDFNVAIDIGQDTDYDAHEVIELTNNVVDLSTALDQGDEDFGDSVVLVAPDESIGYRIEFEEDLDDLNRFDDATDDDSITVPFLGKNLVVTDATATSITAYAGDKVRLRVGDTVQSAGKTVRLDGVDDDSALLVIDGEADSVDEGDRERINDVEIFVDDVFNSDDDANDQAIVVVQGGAGQAVETYSNGEEFVDENEDHFLWEWELAGLNAARPTLGIQLHEDLNDAETGEFEDEIMNLGLLKQNKSYLSEGDYLCLPYRFACLVLEGMDGDMSWNEVTFEIDDSEDLDSDADGDTDLADASVLEVSISGVGTDRGFTALTPAGADHADNLDFSKFWLHYDPTTGVGVEDGVLFYYEDSDTGAAFAFDFDDDGTFADGTDGDEDFVEDGDNDGVQDGEDLEFVRFDNGDYDALITVGLEATGGLVFVSVNNLGANAADLEFHVDTDETVGLDFLGDADGDDTTAYLCYGVDNADEVADCAADGGTNIAGWDNDVMSPDGLIVLDPEGNLDNDQVKLKVPNDDEFEYWVRVAKPKGGSMSSTVVSASGGVSIRDTEVADAAGSGKNVVSVGGPAVNRVSASLLGVSFPTYGADLAGLEEGSAVVELKDLANGKKALLVYGWEADDTRRAAVLLKDPTAFKQKLSDAGKSDASSVSVMGTDLTVAGISVA